MKKVFVYLLFSVFFSPYQVMIAWQKSAPIVLPAGDAHFFGRLLHEKYERGVSYQFAQAVQRMCQEKGFSVIVPLYTHGDRSVIVHDINKKKPHFLIQLYLYPVVADPSLTIFVHTTDMLRDAVVVESDNEEKISLQPVDSIYKNHWLKSQKIAQDAADMCKKESVGRFAFGGLQYAPCKALQGYDVPAFVIECGICSDDGWNVFTQVIADVLCNVGSV